MESTIDVSELLLPEAESPEVSACMIQRHEAALDAVTAGRWDEASALLRQQPAGDGPAHFLLEQMALLGNRPPADWDGAFQLRSK
jgi:hypothetical protein